MRNNNKINLNVLSGGVLLSLGLMFFLSDDAMASLNINTKPTLNPVVTKTVTQVSPTLSKPIVENTNLVSGFGHDLPLSIAVEEMLPNSDWNVVWNGNINDINVVKKSKVSWSEHGATLNMALSDLIAKNNAISVSHKLTFSVNQQTHTVNLNVINAVASVVTPRNYNGDNLSINAEPKYSRESINPIFVLDPALTVRENIIKWGKQAGYQVIWPDTTADYKVFGRSIFTGKFDAPNGPLAQVLSAYNDSNHPLKGKLNPHDKVVFVYNKDYDMPDVVPMTNNQLSSGLNGQDAPKLGKNDGP